MAIEPFADAEIGNDLPAENQFGGVWLRELEAKFGTANFIKSVKVPGRPRVSVLYFDDLPEKGSLTAVTCGLSEARHPQWKFGHPELIVTLDSRDIGWGVAAAYLASKFYGEKPFSYGDFFKLDHPIAQDSEMDAYLLFAPSFLKRDQSKFVLRDRTIHLIGLYPIYSEEIPICERIGLKEFWHADGFEMYNPKRGPVNIAKN